LNILTAISGEDPTPLRPARRWIETWEEGGTTPNRTGAFIRPIINDLGPGTPNNFYVFTCENLNAHCSLVVQQLINGARHRCVFRAPSYWPVDSPVEHLFDTVQISLTQKMYSLTFLTNRINANNQFAILVQATNSVKATILSCTRRIRSFVP
jgi:hypothetical protein